MTIELGNKSQNFGILVFFQS